MEVARQAGLVGRRRVLDSTPVYDAVATMDTVTLVRSAIYGLLKSCDGDRAALLRGLLARDDDYAAAGKPACDYDDPQARHMQLTQTVIATDGREMTLPRQPFTLSRTPSRIARRTPEFAEHTDEILAEFGFSAADIKGFRERGSVE